MLPYWFLQDRLHNSSSKHIVAQRKDPNGRLAVSEEFFIDFHLEEKIETSFHPPRTYVDGLGNCRYSSGSPH